MFFSSPLHIGVSIRVAPKKDVLYFQQPSPGGGIRQWAVRECNRITVGSMEGGRWKNRKNKKKKTNKKQVEIFFLFLKNKNDDIVRTYSHQRTQLLLCFFSASRYIVWILLPHLAGAHCRIFDIWEFIFFFLSFGETWPSPCTVL